jgi:hypothetical protein
MISNGYPIAAEGCLPSDCRTDGCVDVIFELFFSFLVRGRL